MDVTAVSVQKLIADYNLDLEAAKRSKLAAVEEK